MPLYTSIASLSQTPSSNAADGSVDAPSTIDQQTNLLASFIAKLRDGVSFTAGAINTALGFTPVRQGGLSSGTTTNTVSIGYNTSLGKVVCAVDTNQFSNTWPIDITGTSAYSTSAGTASNSNAVSGVSGWAYSGTGGTPAWVWATNGSSSSQFLASPANFSVNYANTAGSAPANGGTSAACSGTAANANTLQGLGPGSFIQNGNNVVSIRSNTVSQLLANIGGTDAFWSCTPVSDARVKKNIAPTVQDSLSKFAALEYVTYQLDASILPGSDERVHKVGVIAQQAKAIEPDWVIDDPALSQYLHLNEQQILMDAMYAIKQLKAEIDALKARP